MLSQNLTSTSVFSQNELTALLKRDLRFFLVFMGAAIPPLKHVDEIEDLATSLLLSKSEFRALRNSLLKHGHWALTELGYVEVKKSHLDLGDISTHEFTNITLGFLTHISEDGPCNYENLFVVTSPELKKEFYVSINRALRDLINKSALIKGTQILGWTHIGVDFGNFEKGMMSEMKPIKRDEE